MLSTFLNQLQTYFSKYFVPGSFCPMLAFAFINGMIAYSLFTRWRTWVDAEVFSSSAKRGAFVTTALGVAIVLAAYVLSSLSTFLRRQLEGKWWERLARLFIPAQNRRRQRMIDELQRAAMDIADLDDSRRWEQQLRDSREIGRLHKSGVHFNSPHHDPIKTELTNLEAARGQYKVLAADHLEQLAKSIAQRLTSYDEDQSPDLARQHQRLSTLIDYAKERARAQHARLQNELNSNFGTQELAATTMGNIANTIQSYALRRYHCNFEVFWSNLQRIVQKDDKAQAALQEAKTQLDFLIACCWLTVLSALIWAFCFAVIEPSGPAFLTAAIGGPAIGYMWYGAAAEQYRSFADVVMTTLDVFRLDLLRDMRLKPPADVEDEHLLWENLDRLTTYGENRNFRYEPPR
jgi:hypothetical protein